MGHSDQSRRPSPSDVLLANQLYYKVIAGEYDKKNYVKSPAMLNYYERLFNQYIFSGRSSTEIQRWHVCDVGCGTGFLEGFLQNKVGSIVAFDATFPMLEVARRKFPNGSIFWVQADGQALPIGNSMFDLVCCNATLHHVFAFEPALARMISLLKTGGKLFVGYEPNAIPYRIFGPLLKLAAVIVPEHRNRERIRKTSGQEQHVTLKDADIHQLAEFHIFQNKGIHPFRLQQFSAQHGIVDSRVHFSSIYQFALLRDSGLPIPLDMLPDWLFRISGRISLSFSLTGTKAQAT
jgi:SAM-dependent methyltransferase